MRQQQQQQQQTEIRAVVSTGGEAKAEVRLSCFSRWLGEPRPSAEGIISFVSLFPFSCSGHSMHSTHGPSEGNQCNPVQMTTEYSIPVHTKDQKKVTLTKMLKNIVQRILAAERTVLSATCLPWSLPGVRAHASIVAPTAKENIVHIEPQIPLPSLRWW